MAESDKLEVVFLAGQMGEETATAPIDPIGLLDGSGIGTEGWEVVPWVNVALLNKVATKNSVAPGTTEVEALDGVRMTTDEVVESFAVSVGHGVGVHSVSVLLYYGNFY